MDANALQLFLGGSGAESYAIPTSNAAMIQDLARTGSLRSEVCVNAFAAVDRQRFWVEGASEITYADVPLRHGRLHLSAPQIYAEALESLMPLKPGMSFLNVGSGTGYFNSLVAEAIGELSTNHGIDIWPETLEHARERIQRLGKKGIEFFLGNVYELDVNSTMRYDRIYLGACANSRSKYLYRLLEVGGVLVGPFQAGRSQQLRRVVRETESEFRVEVLESVRFATLVEPSVSLSSNNSEARSDPGNVNASPRSAQTSRRSSRTMSEVGLPDVPFTFTLHEPPWTLARNSVYPLSFRLVVAIALRNGPSDNSGWCLPNEMWTQHILPWCSKRWFHREDVRSLRSVAIPSSTLPQKAIDDADICSDDGGSTEAPSSAGGSKAQSPTSQLDWSPASEDSSAWDETVLFEVFSNGQRYAIGSQDDPDDMDEDVPRHPFPPQVLQLLASERDTAQVRAEFPHSSVLGAQE